MRMTFLTVVALLFPAAAAYADECKPKHEFKTVTPGVLTVSAVTYMPFSAIDANGDLAGIDGAILKQIAKQECLTVRGIPVDAAAALSYVLSGRADTSSGGWNRTAEREKVLNLSNPYTIDQMGILSKEGIGTFAGLEGKKVGVEQGVVYAADLKKVFGENLKLYANTPQSVQDAEAGRIDAIITSYVGIVDLQRAGRLQNWKNVVPAADERVRASVEIAQRGYPLSKQNPGLLAAFNEAIAAMKKDGTIETILVKFGLDASAANTGDPRLLQ
jgi:polar amino acid transport system substrate-binding protein